MDVFVMIRRKKTTIFTSATENSTVKEIKNIVEGILKVAPENQQLFKLPNEQLDDSKTLADCGYTSVVAKAQSPSTIGLAFRQESGNFETLDITAVSEPPDLPDVMKRPETNLGAESAPQP